MAAFSLFAMSVAIVPSVNSADTKAEMEKCYGVVKAGKNDCAAANGSHSCAAQAKKDSDGGEWLLLPKGTCEKITGGLLQPKKA